MSGLVQGLPSSQPVPSLTAVFLQVPVLAVQESVVHALLSSQFFLAPAAQLVPLHLSAVHLSLSVSQPVPEGAAVLVQPLSL